MIISVFSEDPSFQPQPWTRRKLQLFSFALRDSPQLCPVFAWTNRLVAPRYINDAGATRTCREARCGQQAFLIGSALNDCAHHAAHHSLARFSQLNPDGAADSAHLISLSLNKIAKQYFTPFDRVSRLT
jgi:hypothetical protein